MRILVTGVAGLVGSRLVEVLLEGGHRVVGLDILDGQETPGFQEARLEVARKSDRFSFVRGDVTEAGVLGQLLAAHRPRAVVHLASRKDLDWAEEASHACMRLHAGGTAAVIRACREHSVSQAIVGSTAHVYGGSRRYPFAEDDPADRPLSVLGAAYRAAELCAYAMSLHSPVHVSVLRLFSVYGPRQAPHRLLPILTDAAERHVPMPVFGDGTAGRDMLHVDDAVVGLLQTLDRPAPFRILNLGSGDTTTLDQLAELVAWLMDVELQRERLPVRPGEMPNTYASIEAARKAIGFSPAVGLEEGVCGFVEWYRNRPKAFCSNEPNRS